MSPRFVRSEAVIDSSCLQCLLALDLSFPEYKLFRALSLRYYAVHIPRHVWNEIARRGHRRSHLRRLLREYPFFVRCHVGDDYNARLLYDRRTNPKARIDRGEAETIIQARERGVSDVLIDERKGRKIAQAHTLNPRGIVALIKRIQAKRHYPRSATAFRRVQANSFLA